MKKSKAIVHRQVSSQPGESVTLNLDGEYRDNIIDLSPEQDGIQLQFELDNSADIDGGVIFEMENDTHFNSSVH